MQTLAQNMLPINYLPPASQSSVSSLSKSSTSNFISLKNYEKATFIVTTGAMTEATTSISAYQAVNVSGSSVSTTALNLDVYWTDKATASTTRVFVRTAATSDKVVVDSTNNATYIFEIDAKQLNQASSFDCICLGIAGISAAALFGVTAILHPARYAKDPLITAKAD